ncbi:hypothetical protein ACRHK7_04280 [Weissella tructae]|jgi:hypothetical protein|uniref:Uncharacterized protein n=2 Tax=Weissella TaxID=46255 RepID=A0A075U4J4_9LACO|nr:MULTISPECIES: hypothetical protein [Weissella]AIG65067.1 hypothetical protein WS08_0128 [Weissella tructae]AIM62379.1 hypothetical protein WS74_0127 [Weissella ceti]AIM63717.1 hypothetical protein WS105_0127 [Weissella ceti]ELA07740.1 hypothetical protein WCNC_00627 [Weissella ceti NC36]QVV91466.1 hypothetical protein KHQ32_00735 [Weissella tructae]
MSKKEDKINPELFLATLLQYSRDNNFNHINVSVRLNRNPAYTRQVMIVTLKRISKKYGNDERAYMSVTADNATKVLSLINKLKEDMFARDEQTINWHTDLLTREEQVFGYRQIRERDNYNNLEFELLV